MADADSPRRRDPAADETAAPADSTALEPTAGTDESLGGFDLGVLFGAAAELQAQLAGATEATAEIEGIAGGGAVRIVVTGTGEFRSVHIDPAAVDPDDVDILQDLVLAALHDVTRRMGELRTQQLGALGGGLGDLLGGLGGESGLGGLGDLFSGGEFGELSSAGAEDDEGDERRDDDPPTRPG